MKQNVMKKLKNWRKWNWKHIVLSFLVWSPLIFILLFTLNLGFGLFLVGLIEINILDIIIENSTNPISLLPLVNQSALLIANGLILLQIGILTYIYTFPKAEEWINKMIRENKP